MQLQLVGLIALYAVRVDTIHAGHRSWRHFEIQYTAGLLAGMQHKILRTLAPRLFLTLAWKAFVKEQGQVLQSDLWPIKTRRDVVSFPDRIFRARRSK